MDGPKKIDQAKIFKEKGNLYFKNNQLELSEKTWKKAVEYLKDDDDFKDSGLLDDRNSLLLSVLLNLSLCYLKLKSPVEARDVSEQALQLDSKNEKAWFRKAQANMKLSEYEQAIKDFSTVLEIEPKNTAASRNIILCNDEIATKVFENLTNEHQEIFINQLMGGIQFSGQGTSSIKQMPRNEQQQEDKLIQTLANFLDLGGSIDFVFPQNDTITMSMDLLGTVLHFAIIKGYEKAVEYILNRGANIAAEMTSKKELRFHNALDRAAEQYGFFGNSPCRRSIYKILKKRCLELYSSYGLTSFHLDCAILFHYWSTGTERCLQTAEVKAQINTAISTESPIWPGMTPILIAARFYNEDLVIKLLDLGADPAARDPKGNTALLYLIDFETDKRLYAIDNSKTFGTITGQSHFHIACDKSPWALDIVKRYLDQGVSPELPVQKSRNVGLHIAMIAGVPELITLLLEYGAEVDKKNCYNFTPLEIMRSSWAQNELNKITCICLLIEAGAIQDKIDFDDLEYLTSVDERKRVFLSCIIKLKMLSKSLVSKKLMDLYVRISKKGANGWNEVEFTGRCFKELKSLISLGLRQVLDGTVMVKRNFKDKFGCLDSVDFKTYPIYGNLLKIRFKRKLLEFEKRKKKISQVVPQLQRLFKSVCQLPYSCAELILWNLSEKEFNSFVKRMLNEAEQSLTSFLSHYNK